VVASGFPKSSRLLNAADYQAVFNHSRFKVSCRYILILAAPGKTTCSRLGIIVAKKHVSRAVQRNRIKRLVREWFRHLHLPVPLDLVVLVRKDADTLVNSQLAHQLQRLGTDLGQKSLDTRDR
jgi:ribonuclease P protein component